MMAFCLACRHLHHVGKCRLVCDAFPQGFSTFAIGLGADHRYRIPGDRGIRFEASPECTDEALRRLAALD